MRSLRAIVLAATMALAGSALAQGNAFTYQGTLEDRGGPADGPYQLSFTIWDAPVAGTMLSPLTQVKNLTVEDGLFTTTLDFGAAALVGSPWLEISVDSVTLSPRQPITPAPFSVRTRGVFIDSAGRAGIGTESPVAGLHVERDGSSAFRAIITSPGSGSGSAVYAEVENSSDATWYAGQFLNRQNTSGSANFGVYAEAAGSSGIGVSGINPSPGGKGVSGTANGTNGRGVQGSGGAYDFYASGPGVNYGSPSSIRWKRDVRPVPDALGMLSGIRGVYYEWDDDHGGRTDIGFIGEEVGEIVPEIVAYEPDGEFVTGMDYAKMTPLLVEAVNALRAQHDAEIADLQQQISELKAMIQSQTAWKEEPSQ